MVHMWEKCSKRKLFSSSTESSETWAVACFHLILARVVTHTLCLRISWECIRCLIIFCFPHTQWLFPCNFSSWAFISFSGPFSFDLRQSCKMKIIHLSKTTYKPKKLKRGRHEMIPWSLFLHLLSLRVNIPLLTILFIHVYPSICVCMWELAIVSHNIGIIAACRLFSA